MSFHKSEPISTYDFDEDAMGLGDFITQEMAKLRDDEIVVLVSDQEGYNAVKATFERELLTDGSTVVNLIIKFDREI
jgi:hypothetical protein